MARMIDHVFHERDRLSGFRINGCDDLAGIRRVTRFPIDAQRCLDCVVNGAGEHDAALIGRVAEHDPFVLGITQSVGQYLPRREVGSFAIISDESTIGAGALRRVI